MSGNAHKLAEVKRILEPAGVEVVPVSRKIEELQTEDVDRLVRDKLIKAFKEIGRPLFVEHTGLYLGGLNGLPAGLTQIFWDKLEADRFTKLVAGLGDDTVMAKTVLGYCDGREIRLFEGSIEGTVPLDPVGPRDFQWDSPLDTPKHSLKWVRPRTIFLCVVRPLTILLLTSTP